MLFSMKSKADPIRVSFRLIKLFISHPVDFIFSVCWSMFLDSFKRLKYTALSSLNYRQRFEFFLRWKPLYCSSSIDWYICSDIIFFHFINRLQKSKERFTRTATEAERAIDPEMVERLAKRARRFKSGAAVTTA